MGTIEKDFLSSICKNKASLDIKSRSSEELQRFNIAAYCEICHIKFEDNDMLKCTNLDHCQCSNKFRYASCTTCNLLNRSLNHIQIYFHNFWSNDSKLLLNVINKTTKVRVPPKFLFSNLQKFRSLNFHGFRFKDSLEHLPSSLNKLVTELNNPYQNHTFFYFSSVKNNSKFAKNVLKECIKMKSKLLTNGKVIYTYSLCIDEDTMEKIMKYPPVEVFQ